MAGKKFAAKKPAAPKTFSPQNETSIQMSEQDQQRSQEVEQQFHADSPTSQPGQMQDGSSSEGVSSGDVSAIVAADEETPELTDGVASVAVRTQVSVELGSVPAQEAPAAAEHAYNAGQDLTSAILRIADVPEGLAPAAAEELRQLTGAGESETEQSHGPAAQTFAQDVLDQTNISASDLTAALQRDQASSSAPSAAAADLAPASVAATLVAEEQPEPEVPANISRKAQSAVFPLTTYIQAVAPRKPVTTEELVRAQTSLYRVISQVINGLEGEDFTGAWGYLLQMAHAHRKGVFSEIYLFRGFEDIVLPEAERKAFQRLLNLIKLTADPKSRQIALKQVDITKTLELGLTEPGRQRVLGFYNL